MFIVTRREGTDLRQEVHVYSHAATDGPTSVRRCLQTTRNPVPATLNYPCNVSHSPNVLSLEVATMSSINSESDVLVIGGGVSGLAAAAFLARSGKRVRLFEQSQTLGGRAQTSHRNGFHLNLGPHALYRGGRGIEILRELGIEPKGRVPAVSGAFAIRNGVKHTFPAGMVSLLTTSLFGLSAKLEAARLLSSLAKIDGNLYDGTTVREWLDQTL